MTDKSHLALLLWLLLGCVSARSQAPAPQQNSTATTKDSSQDLTPTFHVNTNLVLVPTLVEQKDGKIIYGLGADAFSLSDNGAPQKIHVDDDLDMTPVSLVVCVQKGRTSALQFAKFARLAPLLNLFLGNGSGEVMLVEFDSQVEFQEDWTKDTDLLQRDFDQLEPGDGGVAVLDAVGYSIALLERRPPERRRILLLLSESRDHGSKRVSAPQLVERIGTSNTLVLSLTWSPAKAEFLDQLVNPGSGSLMQLAVLAANAMKSNAAKSLAVMSGGEAMSFTSEHVFEERVAEMASHARNRYMLSFHPTELTPGLHRIQVELKGDLPARVVARTDYWAVSADAAQP